MKLLAEVLLGPVKFWELSGIRILMKLLPEVYLFLDNPSYDPDYNPDRNSDYLRKDTPLVKVSLKSAHYFVSNPADR